MLLVGRGVFLFDDRHSTGPYDASWTGTRDTDVPFGPDLQPRWDYRGWVSARRHSTLSDAAQMDGMERSPDVPSDPVGVAYVVSPEQWRSL